VRSGSPRAVIRHPGKGPEEKIDVESDGITERDCGSVLTIGWERRERSVDQTIRRELITVSSEGNYEAGGPGRAPHSMLLGDGMAAS
jgi:hypothetical protein